PLLGFAAIWLFGKRLGDPGSGWLATAAIGGSFIATLVTFVSLMHRSVENGGRSVTKPILTWFSSGNFNVRASLLVDPLSITMALFVTGVGTLIHLYSIGYMKGDPRYPRFFLYLNLFAFSMLCLVMADSFLFMFLGWEGVGLCSYLLVSFWFERERAAVAGKKAFVTNRVGDWGFMLAMFLIFQRTGSLTYHEVFAHAFSGYSASAIGLLLFLGACGKSAQLPLYVWLPDAMEGPTPVSALIHAATMVTAGVYLLSRVSPILFQAYGSVGTTIAWVGVITALFAATIACAQDDIKKVLAYSTISQLGYMFLAIGSGAYTAGLFHMITHAFFKALLFLGAGSVIHGLHDEQDMKRMGALRKWMPVTAVTFIVGWLAIAGIPPLSGFWSKDDILSAAYHKSSALYVIGALTAGLTAYYMTRQVVLTFWGGERWREEAQQGEPVDEPSGANATEPEPVSEQSGHGGHGDHGPAGEPHESPWTMVLPLGVLAFLAAVGGLVNLPFGRWAFLERWLEPVLADFSVAGGVSTGLKVGLGAVTTVLCVAGVAVGWIVWSRSADNPQLEPVALKRAWGVDSLYSLVWGTGGALVAGASATFDKYVIDGAVNGVASAVRIGGGRLRKVQTGYVRNYALEVAAGAVVLLTFVFVVSRVGG
ncbi:MAG: NADH-quinone oxidoreductase subunit, partial [Acidimicrobiaceae bacterium]|nr:NADH-quinone oxidoreductase subunit [Acidimicrobiaceae bacterium]